MASRYERLFKTSEGMVRQSDITDWEDVITKDATQFLHIPKEHLTNKLILLACSLYGWNLRWVPCSMQTKKVVQTACDECPESVLFACKRTPELEVKAIMQNAYSIKLMQNPSDEAIQTLKKRSPNICGRDFRLARGAKDETVNEDGA